MTESTPDRSASPAPGPSRRAILAGGATALAASPLIPLVKPARVARPHGDDEIKIGLVGCGGRGTGAANQALRTNGAVKLVAMADAFPDRLEGSLKNLSKTKKIAERIDVPESQRFIGFDAYERLLKTDVDLVILATPPHFRPQQFAAAIAAGRHVFMEKPVAVDGFGVRQVLAAAEQADASKLCVGVGLQRHHQNGYLEVMDQVHNGAIGDIVSARCYWNMGSLWHKDRKEGWSDMEWQMRNWLYFTWLSGDHITEQHIHNLDVINWAKRGFPVKAHGMGGRQVRTDPKFGHIYDHHAVQFIYEDDTYCFSQCRQIPGCRNDVSEHVVGTKGRADMGSGQWTLKHTQGEWKFKGKKNNPYQTEHDDLFAAVRTGQPYNEAHYGAKSTLTAIMGRMATYSGKLVTWDQALASEKLGPDEYAWGDLPIPPVPMPGKA